MDMVMTTVMPGVLTVILQPWEETAENKPGILGRTE